MRQGGGQIRQQLAGLLAGGLAIAQLELHFLPHAHRFGHRHGAVAWIDTDQRAHQEGGAGVAQAGQIEIAASHTDKQGMAHLLPFIRAQIAQDRLQGRHR